MIDSPGDLRMLVEVGNLAPGGVFVRAEQSPPVGSEVELGFRMLANRTCTARGHVAWRGESGFGISFDETNEDMERFARQLIALPVHLHSVYLADVLDPELRVSLE
ncbi:MAG: PilZ domain-containing protein [Proteobacteria bacterium]|nr:PilZ domain-containing protein [Pseudomonadota bacterium]